MRCYHDKPSSQGVANAVKRARQMVEVEWTPLADYPCSYALSTPNGQLRQDAFFPGWRRQYGIVYSSVRKYDRFVGFNISLETFMTAMSNPNSVLYKRPQHGQGRNMSSFYGNVCSVLVSYALELPFIYNCIDLPGVEGMSLVDPEDLDKLQLCDIILNVKTHVAMVTDITRDEKGHVVEIGVSESTPPLCITRPYTPEAFRHRWLERDFVLYRYAGVHNVSYTPSPFVHLEGDPDLEPEVNRTLMPDFGNKANYLKEIEPVELSVFEDGWKVVEVSFPDGSTESFAIVEGKVTVPAEKPGFHTACCVRGEERSARVEWCVVDLSVRTGKEVCSLGEPIRIRFHKGEAGDPIVAYILKSVENLNRGRGLIPVEAAESGEFVITAVDRIKEPGDYGVVVIAQNKYGQYACPTTWFSIE